MARPYCAPAAQALSGVSLGTVRPWNEGLNGVRDLKATTAGGSTILLPVAKGQVSFLKGDPSSVSPRLPQAASL